MATFRLTSVSGKFADVFQDSIQFKSIPVIRYNDKIGKGNADDPRENSHYGEHL